jgi:transcriptional regulator with XRE-family HTH domain
MRYANMIGQQIRSIREAKGYSQDYMADSLNISQSAYACLEAGKTSLRVDRLLEIMKILDADITAVFAPVAISTTKEESVNEKFASYPDLKLIYDQLFEEMKDEISFLRSLVMQGAMISNR